MKYDYSLILLSLIIVVLFFTCLPLVSAGQSTSNDIEYYAIIIGTTMDNLENVEQGDISAKAVYQALENGVNWQPDHIKLLLNENVSPNMVQSLILDWLDPLESEEDVIFFYFNGDFEHSSIKQLLDGTDINDSGHDSDDDLISDQELDTWFDELESDQIYLVLDADFASYQTGLRQWGRSILTATGLILPKKDELAQINGKSVLAHYITKGLNGYADANLDGFIDNTELFSFVKSSSHHFYVNEFFFSLRNPFAGFQSPNIINRVFGDHQITQIPFGWKQLAEDGFGSQSNYATRGMEIFNGDLYIGTQNNLMTNSLKLEKQPYGATAASMVPDLYSVFGDLSRYPVRMALHLMTVFSQGCEVWRYNHSSDLIEKIIGKDSLSGIDSGFGSHFNAAASVMKEFNGYLYVGTWNTPVGGVMQSDRKGCEIWRTIDGVNWEQVVGHQAPYIEGGFGNPDNTGAWSIQVFNGSLYVGTMNWDFSDIGGCEVWRTDDGLIWEQVVDHGFRPFMDEYDAKKEAINTYAWVMQEYQGELYMGTFNARLWLWNERGTGCQLWKTQDGSNWEKVDLPNGLNGDFHDGFGEGENYGIRRMVVFQEELYLGIASSFFHDHGCEIWKYNGLNWTPVISDDVPGAEPTDHIYDGFGSTMNKYIWSMSVTDDMLWVGTANGQVYLPLIYKGDREEKGIRTETKGCEIWCFDGVEWNPVLKDEVGLQPNGLGDSSNLGARGMIEYPKDSGNLIVGTFKLFNAIDDEPRQGCELWQRYVISDDES